ncbi:MAG: hypothetical protein HW419_2428 [Deltaproteobacteria bacterium]|nr:hypothetical protein [Deltaproteobacteria bacterium]
MNMEFAGVLTEFLTINPCQSANIIRCWLDINKAAESGRAAETRQKSTKLGTFH